jgi:hypothetical protein
VTRKEKAVNPDDDKADEVRNASRTTHMHTYTTKGTTTWGGVVDSFDYFIIRTHTTPRSRCSTARP